MTATGLCVICGAVSSMYGYGMTPEDWYCDLHWRIANNLPPGEIMTQEKAKNSLNRKQRRVLAAQLRRQKK